jgi:hypothetical protein
MLKSFGVLVILGSVFLTSCATICGGSKYNATILVNGRPNAEIVYHGITLGNGSAFIKVKRSQADKFSLTIKEKGCQDQTFDYHSRIFRGWALIGTIVTFTTNTYIPYGLGIDLITGALWKPDITERGVMKHNYKNFQYIINYTGCQTNSEEVTTPDRPDMLADVAYLKNGSVVRGTIVEQDPAVQVKIQTKDGSIFVFKISEIERITRE